jgi:thioredoxin 1
MTKLLTWLFAELYCRTARVLSCLQYDQHKYAVAQVETMHATVSSIKYTPTFGIYRNGKRVDEVVGKEPQKLADRLWLHSD